MNELFEGLKALTADTFPKTCACCGAVFADQAQYIAGTVPIDPAKTGFKALYDDDDQASVGWFRNCKCGSTLLTYHLDRRDVSERGLRRRERFAELQQRLSVLGWGADEAREALLGVVLRGEVNPRLREALQQKN
ncbi:hypothetical protein [Atopomonas sediminilitoris]|uniref:hypothetical protein n=1 Tax=Atopomonas sediminilitoris TaxID=2919919 RepID=UPI001F4F0DA3|nr:hypothetical protein [Atopomonas sediminilitoris]MCJ8167860.1 hypothetical protein [Atopomonas sediminilitoris]